MKKKWPTVSGFEDLGKGLLIKECMWPLETGKVQEMNSPLNPPEGTQPCWNLDFNLMRHVGLLIFKSAR